VLFEPLFDALNRANVRYIVVGGLATVLHGHARLTADIDLIVDLVPDEARKAVETFTSLGFRPRAPVEPLAFADARVRKQWIEEKGMRVFALWNPANPMLEVDLFAEVAGRPQDLADIEALEIILRRQERPDVR
jgi:hypothetical protein